MNERIVDSLEPDHPDHYSAHWDRPDGYTVADHAQRFELWEYSHAGWLGLGAAAAARSIGTPDRGHRTPTGGSSPRRTARARFPIFDLGVPAGYPFTVGGHRVRRRT